MARLCALEELVLIVVAECKGQANGTRIMSKLEKQFNYSVSLGGILEALKKLERKGVVTSRFSNPSFKRNEKRMRLYSNRQNLLTVVVGTERIWYSGWSGYIEQLLDNSNTRNEKN